MQTTKLAVTINEAALSAGIGRTRIYAEIRSGRLIARKVGRRTVIDFEDLKDWLKKTRRVPHDAAGSQTSGE